MRNARNTGHKGKRGAVRVCPRGFRTSPSKSLILSASSHRISAFPAESPSSYHLWCLAKIWSTICDHRWTKPHAGPQLTVIYKIVLIPPTILWVSLIVSILVTSHKRTLADVAESHKSQRKSVKCLRPQLCWRWSSQDRMATKGPLLRPTGQCLCAAFRSHGEIASNSGAGSAAQMHTPAVFKDSLL